jgi:hypothetical protein
MPRRQATYGMIFVRIATIYAKTAFIKKAMEKMHAAFKNLFLLSGNRFQSVCQKVK